MNTLDLNASAIRPILLLALWAACFWPVYPSLVNVWLSHSDHSHGLLVPFISAGLVWRKRAELLATPNSVAPHCVERGNMENSRQIWQGTSRNGNSKN